MAEPHHFSIVVLDIEGSGALSGPEKERARADLYAMIGEALRRAGIDDAAVRQEDRGDGIYLLVDSRVSKRRLLDPLVPTIDDALRQRTMGDIPLRLRLVLHHGEAVIDKRGSSGPAVDEAFAMLDANEVKAALAFAPRGRMAVIVPDDLYRGIVMGHEQPNPDLFRMRRLENKRGRIKVWLTVTGAPAQPGSDRREPAPGKPSDAVPVMNVHQGDNNRVRKNTGVVGTTNTQGGNFTVARKISGRGDG
ncbi:hypothetical protein [Actinoplanes solisilvae]|uniref:hypothetical protein n=1 Tax=Actinoplanes solisilvae TaxID=2486853 RepID=UPI000FD90E53|nr:hypothetical protein [Actinoplanes solisilvae]